MKTDYLRCEHCETILGGSLVNTPEPVPCPACQALLLTQVFPAFFRSPDAGEQRPQDLSSDEEAGCFFHPRKKAVVPCANCGRFLCGLCDLEIEDRHLCPTCVEGSRGKSGGAARVLAREHIRYDHQALALSTLGIFVGAGLITAPFALYYAIRYWNTPKEAIIPRGHARQIVAIVLSVAQLAFWGIYLGVFWSHLR